MTSPPHPSTAQEPRSLGLLDVLEQLPRHDLRRSVWLHLSPGVTSADDPPANTLGRSFRLACQRSRGLSNQLTRRLVLCQPEGEGREAALASQAALLGRQEGLEELSLDDDNNDAHDMDAFLQSLLVEGRAACRRLHTLRINSGNAGSGAVGQTIQLCCPNLRELGLLGCSPTPAFCAALSGCTSLHKVMIGGPHGHTMPSELLAELAELGGLQSLDLAGSLAAECVPALAAFTRLTELRADQVAGGVEAADVGRSLSALTQLVKLTSPLMGHSSEALTRVVAQLAGLTNLVDLEFGDGKAFLEIDQVAFDALARLSGLTSLACPAFSTQLVPAAGGGCLPRLQTLHVSACDPVRLAATLRPLLPLPALREFHGRVFCVGVAQPAAGDIAHAPGARTAAAWQAARALAKAPHLTKLHLDINNFNGDEVPADGGLSASQGLAAAIISALLAPLGAALTHLCMDGFAGETLNTAWPLVCLAHRLESLELTNSFVPEGWLLEAVGSDLGALRVLSVYECEGLSGASAVALAGVRTQPLHIKWDMEVEQQQLFQAVARPGVSLNVFDE